MLAAALIGAAPWALAQDEAEPAPPARSQEAINATLRECGEGLLAASPPAHPDDRVARDEAAQRLARLTRLIDAGDEHVVWGIFDAGEPLAQTDGVLVHPLVLVKVYLSLFTFEGKAVITVEDGRTLLQLPATFRDRLMSGEYPEPLWITPAQWSSYTRTTALVFVFEGEDLRGVLRLVGPERDAPAARAWSGAWEWSDIRGRPQPRVAQFGYLLSPDNPEARALAEAHAALKERLRAADCLSCHAPGSGARGGHVTRLHSPIALLAVSESLPRLLARTDLAADDPHASRAGGITDSAARAEMLARAEAFRAGVDAAMMYEAARRAVPVDTEPVLPEAN